MNEWNVDIGQRDSVPSGGSNSRSRRISPYQELARQRREYCQRIVDHAGNSGLSVTYDMVSRNLRIFKRWYEGGLATGYLISHTGARRKES